MFLTFSDCWEQFNTLSAKIFFLNKRKKKVLLNTFRRFTSFETVPAESSISWFPVLEICPLIKLQGFDLCAFFTCDHWTDRKVCRELSRLPILWMKYSERRAVRLHELISQTLGEYTSCAFLFITYCFEWVILNMSLDTLMPTPFSRDTKCQGQYLPYIMFENSCTVWFILSLFYLLQTITKRRDK